MEGPVLQGALSLRYRKIIKSYISNYMYTPWRVIAAGSLLLTSHININIPLQDGGQPQEVGLRRK